MQKMQKTISTLFLTTILFFNFSSVNAQENVTSLHDRLGGVYAIAAVIDDFVEGLLKNEVVAKNEKVAAALGRITKAGLKYRVTEFVSQATGGPEKYTGRTMKDSHAGLAITEEEWNATVGELLKSLAKFSVPKKEQDELIAIVATTKGDIVTAKVPTPPPPAPPPVPETKAVSPSALPPLPPLPPSPPSPPPAPQEEAAPSGELAPPPPDADLPTN